MESEKETNEAAEETRQQQAVAVENSSSSKRHKELENAALQTSLNSLRSEGEEEQRDSEDGRPASPPEERDLTLTDHLNKILLTSFLDQLNQSASTIPMIQRVHNMENPAEDSNRMQEDW
ncbi:uncharacterized protein LOC135360751 [Latimeria chalumnae]|uniref:uncharacterized protein LOC135360751 n=1 Tax=Latimeria chalumnae TaxID=7897 RepID=UPI00313F3BE5